MSSAVKLSPTSLLKVKVKVTGPWAVMAGSLSVIVTVGRMICGGGSPAPPPQAASNIDIAKAQVNRASLRVNWIMTKFLLAGNRCDGDGLNEGREGRRPVAALKADKTP
jgi:hypothetical protein